MTNDPQLAMENVAAIIFAERRKRFVVLNPDKSYVYIIFFPVVGVQYSILFAFLLFCVGRCTLESSKFDSGHNSLAGSRYVTNRQRPMSSSFSTAL